MALDQSALLNLLAQLKLTDVTDRIRSVTETLYQELINAEAENMIGAGKYERTDDRTTQLSKTTVTFRGSHYLDRVMGSSHIDTLQKPNDVFR